jgi:hypothetical protein
MVDGRTVATLAAALVSVFGSVTPAWAQKSTCEDIPIRWTIYASSQDVGATAIRGDGDWYSAASGNSNVVVHVCGDNPSGDATMVVGSQRRVEFDLTVSRLIPGSGAGVNSGLYANASFLNVRNLLFDRVNPFTTRMSINLPKLANRQDHRLNFLPTVADTALRRYDDPTASINDPAETSAVVVDPQAYDCDTRPGGTLPAWIVRGVQPNPDGQLQVATLTQVGSKGSTRVGQYSLPFEIRIEALTCVGR